MLARLLMIGALGLLLQTGLAGLPQSGDQSLDTARRVLDRLFSTAAHQQPYLLKLVLRFSDTASQIVVTTYADPQRNSVRRCDVTIFELDGVTVAQFGRLIAELEAANAHVSDDQIASRLRVKTSHFSIDPDALQPLIEELRAIRMSPALDSRIVVDSYARYDLWYDDWQTAVHYSITSAAGTEPQDELAHWMDRFRRNIQALVLDRQAP